MPQLKDENEKVTNSVIPNGTEAKVMRNLIENKGLLNGKGKLYAGTDDTTSTGAPVTTAINPSGVDDGSVLIKDFTKDGGWTVDKIGNKNITNRAITGDKLAENFTYVTSDTSSFCLQDSSNNSTPRLSFVESNNHASVALQADLKSQELEGKSYTLTLPNENGTLATKEQIENGEIVAQTSQNATNATYAQYASEDTSKGTIEERLTSLGFKTGSLEILADSKGRKPYVNLNLIRKEGNIVTIYYSGDGGKVDLDSTNLRRFIIGRIPNEFWPSTAVDNNITELSSTNSTLNLVKFNNEWYLQGSSTISAEIFAYNLNQPHNPISDAPFISNIPEIIVPEGSDTTTITQSVIDDFNWDSIEDIPYILMANNTYIDITYDKSNGSVDRNTYSNAILHDTSSGQDTSYSIIIGIGAYTGYHADLQASWNKSTKTISYTLTKYKPSSLIKTTEGIATVKPSVTQIRNLKISSLDIFV